MRHFEMSNQKIKKEEEEEKNISKEKIDPEIFISDQKGLRNALLKIIFSYSSPQELLLLGLVNKEWLEISRKNFLWIIHFKKDYCSIFDKTSSKDDSSNENFYFSKYWLIRNKMKKMRKINGGRRNNESIIFLIFKFNFIFLNSI